MKKTFLTFYTILLASCATTFDEVEKTGRVLSKELAGRVTENTGPPPWIPSSLTNFAIGSITWSFMDALAGKKKDVYVYTVAIEGDNSVARIASYFSGFSIGDCMKVLVFKEKGAKLETDSIKDVRMAYGADCRDTRKGGEHIVHLNGVSTKSGKAQRIL